MNRTDIGRKGEDAAVRYLQQQGLKIIERNFRIRGGEIDIVALDGLTLCFIEVKTRRSVLYGDPRESVSFFKQDRLLKAGYSYLAKYDLPDADIRFDVVIVLGLQNNNSLKFDWLKNAFET